MTISAPCERPDTENASPLPMIPTPSGISNEGGAVLRKSAVRCILPLVLLIAEILWLTWRYDTASLSRSGGFWNDFFQWVPRLLRVGIAVVAVALVFRYQQLRTGWRAFLTAASTHSHWSRWLIAQGIAFAAFALVTHRIYEAGALSPLTGLLWLILGIAAVGSGVSIAAAPALWGNVFRREWRFACGILGVGILIGVAGMITQSLWEGLSQLTFSLVGGMLAWMYPEMILDAETRSIGTPQFWVEIAPQCSGYEGIGLIVVLLGVFFFSCRDRLRFPHAFLLWPLGIALIFLCNAIRITALIVIGSSYSPELAMGGFHAQGGWLFFNLVGLVIVAVGLKVPWLIRDSNPSGEGESPATPVSGYLLPFLAVVLLNLILPAFTQQSELLYPVKVFSAIAILFVMRKQIRPLDWRFSWQGLAVGVAVFALWIGVGWWEADRSVGTPESVLSLSGGWMVFWMICRVCGAILTIPVIEELAFRGYLMRRLDDLEFSQLPYQNVSWKAVAISSLLFGLTHSFWIAGILAGLAYAALTRRRNNLGDAILAHAVTNALIALTVLTTNAWWLW